MQTGDYTIDYDNYTMAPWIYKDDQWSCFDNVESIEIKVSMIGNSQITLVQLRLVKYGYI